MIEALGPRRRGAGRAGYLDAAARAADFLLTRLSTADGRLRHYWRGGRAAGEGYLDDYASVANALLTLDETRFEERWLDAAATLADEILRRFADPDQGGFFYAAPTASCWSARKTSSTARCPAAPGWPQWPCCDWASSRAARITWLPPSSR